jgi:pimeloyl-ACP methyl ester carboxylesterase
VRRWAPAFRPLALALIVGAVPAGVAAKTSEPAVFQYRTEVAGRERPVEAFLWVPPDAERIRGVVVAGMTVMERELVQDSEIRAVCRTEGLAVVFFRSGLGSVDVPGVLAVFAAGSGYDELATAPVFLVGHSAGGPQAKAWARRLADRCFGLVLFRGGVPGGSDAVPETVPTLALVGQFDEFGGVMRDASGREAWERVLEEVAAERAESNRLGGAAIEAGAGHFAWSDRSADVIAEFLRATSRRRIAAEPAAPGAAVCRRVEATEGWLTPLRREEMRSVSAAPVTAYAGDPGGAGWLPSAEVAAAVARSQAGFAGRRDQFLRWADPFTVEAGVRYFFSRIAWISDGQTFSVSPVPADVYPPTHAGEGPVWAEAGRSVGASAGLIRIRAVSGPIEVAGPAEFRLRYSGLTPAGEPTRVTFLAFREGDTDYRYTELVGMLARGFEGARDGQPQTLSFPQPHNPAPGRPVDLRAASDAGLPVEFYVAYGPGRIRQGRLEVAELPRRAPGPLEIKVVAWQFGRRLEPQVAPAVPVARSVTVNPPPAMGAGGGVTPAVRRP